MLRLLKLIRNRGGDGIMRVDLIKLSMTEEGELLTEVQKQLGNDLGNKRLREILSHMNKVAQIVAESINELEGEDENE